MPVRSADAVRAGESPLPDPDPPLNDLEKQGKVVFGRARAHCHSGPGLSTTPLPVAFRFHDIATQCPRPVDPIMPARFAFAACPERFARNARTYEITLATGAKIRRTGSGPGRALLTGFVGGPTPADDWKQARHIFHNNNEATLEEVVDHYIESFKFVKVNAPPNVVAAVASTDGVNTRRECTHRSA